MPKTIRYIRPFFVMGVLGRAKELERLGRDVIHLEIGEPDFPTPEPVIEAARAYLERGRIGYTPAGGLQELREAISRYCRERYGIEIAPERIFVTPGASGALLLILAMTVAPGMRVLMGDPGYPCYANLVRLFHGVPALVPVGAETRFHLTAEGVADHWNETTAGLILASPSNPTGTVIAAATLEHVIRVVEDRRGFVLSDEIYHGLEYGKRSPTALQYSDSVFVINSFSKYFGMTGWRIGWAIVPSARAQEAERLAQNLFISAPAPAQYAALAAFSPACVRELERRRTVFAERRDFLLAELPKLGFAVPVQPDGAFYLYADCSRHTHDSGELALNILEQTAVAVTPGKDFGQHRAQQFLRFSYTAPLDRLADAIERLGNHLQM